MQIIPHEAIKNMNIDSIILNYVKERTSEIVKQVVAEAQETIRKRVEEESLKIAVKVAQFYRVENVEDVITISVVKKK